MLVVCRGAVVHSVGIYHVTSIGVVVARVYMALAHADL